MLRFDESSAEELGDADEDETDQDQEERGADATERDRGAGSGRIVDRCHWRGADGIGKRWFRDVRWRRLAMVVQPGGQGVAIRQSGFLFCVWFLRSRRQIRARLVYGSTGET